MHNNEFSHFLPYLRVINRILPSLFWISVIMSFDEIPIAMLTLAVACIHEIGHITLLLFLSKSSFSLKGVSSGLRISGHKLRSYKEELALYLSGPLMNIACAIISVTLFPSNGNFSAIFSALNLATAISNLLPIEGYDGYGALKCLFLINDNNSAVDNMLPRISFFTILLLCICSLYFIDRFGEGYWIFFIFSVSLIKKLNHALLNAKNEI